MTQIRDMGSIAAGLDRYDAEGWRDLTATEVKIYRKCAVELEALIASQKTEDKKDLTRVGDQVVIRLTGSTASTD